MQWWQAVLLGIVEGVTEFLPISSTFHLLFSEQLLGIARTEFSDVFVVVIQMFTMIPLLVIFGKEWFSHKKLLFLTAAGFVPTALVGLVGYSLIKNTFFDSPALMLGVFILIGILFFIVEWFISQNKLGLEKPLASLSTQEAVLIGVAQGCAVLPGVSRSGAIIICMLLLGYRREAAARFSFMLAVPTLTMAGLYDLYKMRELVTSLPDNLLLLVIGSVAATISAWLVIEWLLAFVKKHSFVLFGWYRVAVGLSLVIWLVLNR